MDAEEGHPDAAIQTLVTSYKLNHTVAAIPVIIALMVVQADYALTSQGVEQVINRTTPTDAQLARPEAVLYESCDPDSIVRALAAERCFGLYTAEQTSNYGPGDLSAIVVPVLRGLGIIDLSLVRHLDRMAAAIEIAQMDPWKQQKATQEAEARYDSSGVTRVLNWLTPVVGRLITLDLESTARLQVARTAVAVERYRLARGHLPDRLADLVPSFREGIPIDPFDGQVLRYAKREPGYVVYSIGPDTTDDGGAERQPRPRGQSKGLPHDVTFIVER